MPADRRHDPDPHPPPGVCERRCSDEQCKLAREEWLEDTVLPTLMNRFYKAVAAMGAGLAALFFFIASVAIDRFELRVKDTYESVNHHNEDFRKIEAQVASLNVAFAHTADEIISRLDRNRDDILSLKEDRR